MAVLCFFLCFFLIALSLCDELYQGRIGAEDVLVNTAEEDPKCTNHMHKFYQKMKCDPEYVPGSVCPTSYKCPALTGRSHDHCYHEGRKYPIGANISTDLPSPCMQTCQCVRLYEGVRFVCIPTAMNHTCPGTPGCQRFAFLEDFPCCEVGISSCNNEKKDSVKCMYGGHSYSEGEKIIVSKDPTCVQCICASGFNGSISSKFCRKLSCALEFWGDAPIMLGRGCIPLYLTEDGCCPVAFRCPEPTDQVIKNTSAGPNLNQTVERCVFGNLSMEVGDRLSQWLLGNGKQVECSCRIPPWPSCVTRDFVIPDSLRRDIAREGLD